MRGRPKQLPTSRVQGAIAAALASARHLPQVTGNFATAIGNATIARGFDRHSWRLGHGEKSTRKGERTKRTKHRRRHTPRTWRRARVLKLRARQR